MSMKVLIADNDWHFAKRASAYLESRAHTVVSHTEQREIMNCIRRWQPDLLILGAELAESNLLNQINSLSPRPAVLLTEHMSRYDRAWRAWQKGGDELLMKPVFKTSELNQAIVTAMENAAANSIFRPVAATA